MAMVVSLMTFLFALFWFILPPSIHFIRLYTIANLLFWIGVKPPNRPLVKPNKLPGIDPSTISL